MTVLAGYKGSVYVSNTGTSTATTNEAMTDDGTHGRFYVTSQAHRYLDPAVTPVVQLEQNDVQTVTLTGSPTGGSIVLGWNGNNTASIAYNASAATVQADLVALPGIGSGQVSVTGPNGGPWQVEFTGTLALAAQPAITLTTNNLTGGTSPNVSFAHQVGQGWTTLSSGYTLGYCGGVVVLTTPALTAGVAVRLSTANYLTISQAIHATQIEFNPTIDVADITTFASAQANNGYRSKMALLGDCTVKISKFWIDNFYMANLGGLLVVVGFGGANANQQLACYAYLKTDGIKFDPKAVEEESLDFESHGPIYALNS